VDEAEEHKAKAAADLTKCTCHFISFDTHLPRAHACGKINLNHTVARVLASEQLQAVHCRLADALRPDTLRASTDSDVHEDPFHRKAEGQRPLLSLVEKVVGTVEG
jgi:hypothetical protein